MLQEAGHIKNTVVLIFKHILCLHLMNSEELSSGTQVQPPIILDPDYLPDYLYVSYDHSRLEHDSHLAIEWYECNFMKLNQDKCHLLASGYKHENIGMNCEVKLWESSKQKLLGVVIDRDLSFNEYVSSL